MEENPYAPPVHDPLAPAAGPAVSGQPQGWEVGEVIQRGFEALKKNPGELIGGFFITTLISALPGQLVNVLTLAGVVEQNTVPYFVVFAISMVFAILVSSFIVVGQVRVALAAARGEAIDFGLFFSGADRMVPMLILQILWSLAVTLGLVLLIVPGVILMLGWMLATFFIVDTESTPIEALRESWATTTGEKGKLFLWALLAFALTVAGVCACYVGLFVAVPIIWVSLALIYVRLTGRTGRAPGAAVGF